MSHTDRNTTTALPRDTKDKGSIMEVPSNLSLKLLLGVVSIFLDVQGQFLRSFLGPRRLPPWTPLPLSLRYLLPPPLRLDLPYLNALNSPEIKYHKTPASTNEILHDGGEDEFQNELTSEVNPPVRLISRDPRDVRFYLYPDFR